MSKEPQHEFISINAGLQKLDDALKQVDLVWFEGCPRLETMAIQVASNVLTLTHENPVVTTCILIRALKQMLDAYNIIKKEREDAKQK